jgi:hypothetical protein
MGLIGSNLVLGLRNDDIRALAYEEVFDHHDPDEEVDLVLVIKEPPKETLTFQDKNENEVVGGTYTITDYITARVGRNLLLTEDDDPVSNWWAIDNWFRSLNLDPATFSYVVMHKHPEGHQFVSGKDRMMGDALTDIDFINGNGRNRNYTALAVVTRDEQSIVAPPMAPLPVEVFDIDALVAARMARQSLEKHPDKFDADTTAEVWTIIHTLETLAGDYRESDNITRDEIAERGIAHFMRLLDIVIPIAAGEGPHNHEDDSPKAQEMRAAMRAELLEMGMPENIVDMIMGNTTVDVDGGKAMSIVEIPRVDLPQLTAAEPEGKREPGIEMPTLEELAERLSNEPPARPSSLFDLPAIDDLDDKKPRLN